MNAIEDLLQGIKHVEGMLAESVFEPDLARTDWLRLDARVRLVEGAVENDVLGAVDAAIFEAQDPDLRGKIRERVAQVLASFAVLLFAVGRRNPFFSMTRKAAELASDEDSGPELEAAAKDPEGFCRLTHGRWLQEHDRRVDGDRVLKAVASATKEPAIKAAAKRALRRSKPLTSAPALFRLNGCGVGLYGERDRRSDGFYIATYCLCIFFIPVLPLTAYRVRRAGANSFQFLAREALSGFARACQIAVLAGGVIAIGWTAGSNYLASPVHKANVAMDEARALEAKGQADDALEKYQELIRIYASDSQVNLDAATEAVVRISAAHIPDPCAPTSIDAVGRVVGAFMDIPVSRRGGGAPATLLAKKLAACASQIGDATQENASAALTILELGARVAKGTAEAAGLEDQRTASRRALADRVAAERPLQALALYVAGKPDDACLARAEQIIGTFGESPSLWIEADQSVEAWLSAASAQPTAKAVRAKLTSAREAFAEEKKLVDAPDEKALAARLAKGADHQEIAIALGEIQRARGDTKLAITTLRNIGALGRLTADARRFLGACLVEVGDLEGADAALTSLLDERLAAFQDAQRAYVGAANQLRQKIVADVRANVVEPELERRMTGTREEEQGDIFSKWLSERVTSDSSIAALKAEYLRQGAVIPASISLGTVKLRRANAATGAERTALLAAAERVFLAIRTEAEGDPTFELGLGQVYHRLGRAAEGDAELARVLDKNDPELSLEVAGAYRELGMNEKARPIVQKVYDANETSLLIKQSAARIMALIVSDIGFHEEEEEQWLRRADTKNEGTSALLLELEAGRDARQGKLDDADRAYAKASEIYGRDAAHNSASANNAAVAQLARYSVTGDPAHVRDAVRMLDAALRLRADNAITMSNLAGALEMLGFVTVLDKWVKTKTLFLGGSDLDELLGLMLESSIGDDVGRALRSDASIRRSVDLLQQAAALAPQRADLYRKRMRLLQLTRDMEGLTRLTKELEPLAPFDTEVELRERHSWENKARDAETKTALEQVVARSRETVARAERGGHAPTTGAAWAILARDLASLAFLDNRSETLEEAVDAGRKAAAAWSPGGMNGQLPYSLLAAAAVRAAAESPELKKVWEAESRVYSTNILLSRAVRGPDRAAILAALGKRPEIAEAARLRVEAKSKLPGLLDMTLADLGGGADIERAAADARKREDLGQELAIDLRLAPGLARETAVLELYRAPTPAP